MQTLLAGLHDRNHRALLPKPSIALRTTAALACALSLSACKTFSPDGGMDVVASIAGSELLTVRTPEDAARSAEQVARLLKRPLTADTAVQVALLNNRGLQAAYNVLGMAEAAMVEASLPPSPTISISRLASPVELEIERKIVASVLALATLPARTEVAGDRFRQAQLRAAEETLRVAANARRAYYQAVASRELIGFLTQAKSAAEAATQIARRLGETGAINKLDQAREQVFYAEITAQLATVRQRAATERERLIRALGLWGGEVEFRLPSALPILPALRTLPSVEIEAVRRRVDLQIARIEVDALAKSYGLTGATRFINLLEVAGVSKTTREADGTPIRARGVGVEFQIPLFDFGEARVRHAEQTYMQAVNRLIEKAVSVRSEARDAYGVYRSTYDIAAHYRREVLPLRKIISDETILRYNAMQIDVFALLLEARQRIMATTAAIEAQRNFWLATTNLLVAVVGGGPPGDGSAEQANPTTALPTEPAGH
jgi:outer membrane protein TolC